ncbi:MAG: transposase, partial [Micromonospora sp.]
LDVQAYVQAAEAAGVPTAVEISCCRAPYVGAFFVEPVPALDARAVEFGLWSRSLQTGITNADSEGVNRVIKAIAGDAYGFRNPKTSAYARAAPRPAGPAGASAPLNFEEPACFGSSKGVRLTG